MAFKNIYEISANEKQAIVNTLNDFRQNVYPEAKNMKMISWDNEFEKKLKELRDTKGSQWFFTKNSKYINPTIGYIPINNYNLYHVMKYMHNADKSYNYLFHDTFDSSNTYPVKKIFDYRIKQDKILVDQKKCLIFNKCSSSQYTNYETCRSNIQKDATNTFELDSNDPCLFSNRYAQRLKYGPIKSIACIAMHTPGPHTPKPKKQDESFLCYASGLEPVPKNDIPYVKKSI